jgi:hypothetical protein
MNKEESSRLWSLLELVVIVGAAAAIFLSIGRRDQIIEINSLHITELRSIATELVKSQVLSEANDSVHLKQLEGLHERIINLEGLGR